MKIWEVKKHTKTLFNSYKIAMAEWIAAGSALVGLITAVVNKIGLRLC